MIKAIRIEDRALLDTYHNKRCLCCSNLSDPCHIVSRGAGGPDLPFNLMPLCRRHHTQQHKQGWKAMALQYPKVYLFLKKNGWTFDQNGSLWNDLLKV